MAKAKSDADHRIVELEDTLKAAELRLTEVREELNVADDLIGRLRENLKEHNEVTESYQHGFNMKPTEDGTGWYFTRGIAEAYDELLTKHRDLRKRFNKLIDIYNPQAPGRPLNASEAQCVEVVKLHKRKLSLRDIAEETSLALSTVRTIVGRENRTDRTSIKRLQKLDPMNAAAVSARARKRTRDTLPERTVKVLADAEALLKEARGLGKK
jgi:chromosome segregation ATPase